MGTPDLKSLRYFVAVAEERSVAKASVRLNMAQPPLSVQIRNLESALGTPLFQRGPRGMELTGAGAALLLRAKEALLLANEGFAAARAAGSRQEGRMTVGTMFVLLYLILPGLVEECKRRLPETELHHVELGATSAANAVLQSEVTVALSIPPIIRPGISVEIIGSQDLMLVLRSDAPLARLTSVPPSRLAGAPLIGLPVIGGDIDQSVTAVLLRRHGIVMPIVQRVETAISAMALVLAGKGYALLPACAQMVRPPGIVFRRVRAPDFVMQIGACWRSGSDVDLIRPVIDGAAAVLAATSVQAAV